MSNNSWCQTLVTAQTAGTAITAASRTSATPTPARFSFPPNQLKIGDTFSVRASGIISCVVTTPGTARFDIAFGSSVVWDSTAINLNTTAKTNVPWFLDVDLTVRSIGSGTSATIIGQGRWTSEAGIASAAPAAGGVATFNVPPTTIAVGTGFDSTTSNIIDLFFTQTVATGSMTLQQFKLIYET